MDIVYRELELMHPNPDNPRLSRGKEAVAEFAEQITANPKFFEARPILLSNRTGTLVIIGGERRWEAALYAGLEKAPSILIEGLTPEEEARYMILDNTHVGKWDEAKLEKWDASQLRRWGVDGVKWAKPDHEIKEDDFDPDKKVKARCKTGDIWKLGEHRLMCGDALDIKQVKELMGGELADMVFTDPPYGVSYTDKNEFLNRIDASQRLTNPIENDNHTPAEMAKFWTLAFNNLAAVTKEKMAYYITAPQGGDLLLLLQSIAESPFSLKHMLIWNKNIHVLGRCDYNYKHEPIIYGWKKGGTHVFYGGGKFNTSVWDIPKPLKNDLHPTMKPVELVANCILDATKEGDAVVDIFGGSGTTIIAAEELHRRAFVMEVDPHYCDVIIYRWEQYTGKKAKKIV